MIAYTLTRTHVEPQRKRQRHLTPLWDGHGRRIDHLRMSVTGACDLRCVYCRPVRSGKRQDHSAAWSDEQRVTFVRYLHERYGLSQVRLTGGEPLVYGGLARLVAAMKEAAPKVAVVLTTNGRLLAQRAGELRKAGLDRLNVSLDSLDAARYRRITGGRLADVMNGLDAAGAAGFAPPKINTVVLRDLNDFETADLAEWALKRGCEIRFLEAMPIGAAADFNRRAFVSAAEVRSDLSNSFTLTPLSTAEGTTARRFAASGRGVRGLIGTIAPVTEPFCSACRRIRLTADGRLFPCLLHDDYVDMNTTWRGSDFDAFRADGLLHASVSDKPARGRRQSGSMIQLGG